MKTRKDKALSLAEQNQQTAWKIPVSFRHGNNVNERKCRASCANERLYYICKIIIGDYQ
jgi:hypothetical protein